MFFSIIIKFIRDIRANNHPKFITIKRKGFMMKKVLCVSCILLFVLFMLSCAKPEQEAVQEGIPVDEIFDYAAGQLTKAVAKVQDGEQFPFYTDKVTGNWVSRDDSWWASGFSSKPIPFA